MKNQPTKLEYYHLVINSNEGIDLGKKSSMDDKMKCRWGFYNEGIRLAPPKHTD